MKKNYSILFLFLFLISLNNYAQKVKYLGKEINLLPQTKDELKNTSLIYNYRIDSLSLALTRKEIPKNKETNDAEKRIRIKNANDFEKEITSDKPNIEEVNKLRSLLEGKVIFNNDMLNVFFANEVSKNFNGTSDLTLEKFYASIDAGEKSLALGATFVVQRNKLSPLTWVFNVGMKAELENKFSTIYKNGKLDNSEFGITGKISKIGRGSIYYKKAVDTLSTYYKNLILKKQTKKIEKYIDSDYKSDLDSLRAVSPTISDLDKAEKAFIKEKFETFYKEIADKEIAFIKKNDRYTKFTTHWLSLDFFIPIGAQKYKYSDSENNPNYKTSDFYPWQLGFSATKLWKYSNNMSIFLTGQISAFNNNTFLLNSAVDVNFETITNQSPTQQSVSKTEKVFIGSYDNFTTTAFRLQFAFFPVSFIGISPAIEQNAGSYYHKTNWKLGIPFSLKDKDEKPTVNFEVQWKQQNDDHYVGLSVSYLFGKF